LNGVVGVYDQIEKGFQDIVAPELHALRGDIRVLDQRIDGVDCRLTIKIDSRRTETISLKGELIAEIRRLDTRIDGVDRELRTAIDVRERLAALEARRTS
jgi:hypothetical protein